MKKIILLSGGRSTEREVSLMSANTVYKALNEAGFIVDIAQMTTEGHWLYKNKELFFGSFFDSISNDYEIAVIMMHGEFGEDGKIQAIMESLRIPYIGSDVLASAMAMNKNVSNYIFQHAGLSVPRYVYVDQVEDIEEAIKTLRFPVFVKDNEGGSSFGTFKTTTAEEAKEKASYLISGGATVIVQEEILGRELTCGVFEDQNDEIVALSPTEIIPQTSNFFDSISKYEKGKAIEVTPAEIGVDVTKQVQGAAIKAHQVLRCRDFSRSDFILGQDGVLYILEINTLPGFTATSLLPQAIHFFGVSLSEFFKIMVFRAVNRKQ